MRCDATRGLNRGTAAKVARPACFLCLCQAMRVLASKLMFCTSGSTQVPGWPHHVVDPKIPRHHAQKVIGLPGSENNSVVGNGSGGRGRGRPEVLSQLLLHVSYVFQPSRRIDLSVWTTRESNRIDSGDCRVESAAYAGSDVDALCVVLCCAVSRPAREAYPSTNPARFPLLLPSPAQQ